MSNVVSLTARDGSAVEFVNSEPKQGAIKDVFFSPDRSYVVAFFRKELGESGRRRIEKLVGEYYKSIFNRVGGEYWRTTFCWPEKIVEYEGRLGVVMPVYSPNFYFQTGNLAGEEKEGKWWASAKNYNRFVPPEEKGTLGGFLRACLELSRAVRRMHATGLAHSDLSYKNCLIDPKGGRACIIDVDGLVVPGLFAPEVLGTRDFIAPEVVATSHLSRKDPARVLPSRSTDLHALAVMIYLCLLHRHPLQGESFSDLEAKEQEKMQMGEHAVFIEHPTDSSNRRKVSAGEEKSLPWVDPEQVPYTVCGPYLKALFDQAFIEGLHTPMKRPIANAWEESLVKTLDLLLPCSNPRCVKHEFVYREQPKQICPYCGAHYKDTVPVFEYFMSRNGVDYLPEGRKLVAYEGKELFLWHIDKTVEYNEKLTANQKLRVAYFTKEGDDWILNNERIPHLYDLTNQKAVPCGSSVKLDDCMRLSLCDEKRSYVAQIRIVNRVKQVGLAEAALGVSLDLADAQYAKRSKRVDAILKKVQSLRLPVARVGAPFRYKLSYKDLCEEDKGFSLTVLETRGFEEFGLSCRAENDALLVDGVPTKEYSGRVDFYINGRFKSSYQFGTKARIPGEFRFANVHISKQLEIKSGASGSSEAAAQPDIPDEVSERVPASSEPGTERAQDDFSKEIPLEEGSAGA